MGKKHQENSMGRKLYKLKREREGKKKKGGGIEKGLATVAWIYEWMGYGKAASAGGGFVNR